jgi:MoxR-like ATPase
VARARAAAEGRSYVLPDDLKALAEPVLAHRLLVTPEAQLQGITAADCLAEVVRVVPVPSSKPR